MTIEQFYLVKREWRSTMRNNEDVVGSGQTGVDKKGAIWRGKADELDAAKRNFLNAVRQLEGALGEKDYFGGDVFGYVDVIAIAKTSWFPAYERFGGLKVEDHCPKLTAWIKRCMGRERVAKVIPDATQVCKFVAMLRKMMGIE